MELKIDLSKVLYRADQVEVGKEYYLFYRIEPKLESEYLERGVINSVTDDPDYPFESNDTAYTYAYPVPKKKKRPMTFEEIKEYWKNHRTEIYSYAKQHNVEDDEAWFMLMGFETQKCDDGDSINYIYFNDGFMDYATFITHVIREDGTKLEIEED